MSMRMSSGDTCTSSQNLSKPSTSMASSLGSARTKSGAMHCYHIWNMLLDEVHSASLGAIPCWPVWFSDQSKLFPQNHELMSCL